MGLRHGRPQDSEEGGAIHDELPGGINVLLRHLVTNNGCKIKIVYCASRRASRH